MLDTIYLLIRRCRSAFLHADLLLSKLLCYAAAFGNPSISIGRNCSFGRAVKLRASDGGSVSIGQGTCLADYVQLVVHGGKLSIGNDVFIGTGSIIVCQENIVVGNDTLIAEYVVVRDQDHCVETRPVRKSGFHTAPVHIGHDVWIGCKATVLRGATVGDQCVIGAHTLVKSTIPDNTLAVGVPARVVKHFGSSR